VIDIIFTEKNIGKIYTSSNESRVAPSPQSHDHCSQVTTKNKNKKNLVRKANSEVIRFTTDALNKILERILNETKSPSLVGVNNMLIDGSQLFKNMDRSKLFKNISTLICAIIKMKKSNNYIQQCSKLNNSDVVKYLTKHGFDISENLKSFEEKAVSNALEDNEIQATVRLLSRPPTCYLH